MINYHHFSFPPTPSASPRFSGIKNFEKQPKGLEKKAEVPERGQGKRILNQSSQARHADALHAGHVINNQIFTGREDPPPKPRTRPSVPVWDRLSGPEMHARAEDAPTGWENEYGRNIAHGHEIRAGGAVVGGADHRQLSDGRLAEETAITRTSTPRTTVPVLNLSMKP